MADYIFEEDSNLLLDSKRPFCMDLVGFLKGSTYEHYLFAFDQMRKGLCLFKDKCPRYLGTLPKQKSRFYISPSIVLLEPSHSHRLIQFLIKSFQTSLF